MRALTRSPGIAPLTSTIWPSARAIIAAAGRRLLDRQRQTSPDFGHRVTRSATIGSSTRSRTSRSHGRAVRARERVGGHRVARNARAPRPSASIASTFSAAASDRARRSHQLGVERSQAFEQRARAPRRADRRPWRAPCRARPTARSISASNSSPSAPAARAEVSRSSDALEMRRQRRPRADDG